MMKKEYTRPNIGFTAFRNSNRTNAAMTLNSSDPVGLGSPKMDSISTKVNPLPKS